MKQFWNFSIESRWERRADDQKTASSFRSTNATSLVFSQPPLLFIYPLEVSPSQMDISHSEPVLNEEFDLLGASQESTAGSKEGGRAQPPPSSTNTLLVSRVLPPLLSSSRSGQLSEPTRDKTRTIMYQSLSHLRAVSSQFSSSSLTLCCSSLLFSLLSPPRPPPPSLPLHLLQTPWLAPLHPPLSRQPR